MNSVITVLGSANADLVVRQERLPLPGETIFGIQFSTGPGGKGLNQAIAAARAGGSVAFLGAVGPDGFGDLLRTSLRRDGIDVSGLETVDAPTGTAHIAVVDGGENSIVVVPGANAAQTELDEAMRRQIAASAYLLVQLERPLELVAAALAFARECNVTTVLTPAPVQAIDGRLLRLVDILIPNEREACELAGVDDVSDAAGRLSADSGLVIVTQGARGGLIAREGAVSKSYRARSLGDALDTTGAGDTFVGTLVARLAQGEDFDSALLAAVTAAAISVTRPGASSSMPGWAEVEAAR